MLIVALMAAGALAVVAAWRLVTSNRATVFVAMSVALGAAGSVSLATGRVALSPDVSPPVAAAGGALAGLVLYCATFVFVLVVRRWRFFDRHVAEIYDQRRGRSLAVAILVAGMVVAPFEEFFWRGLFQWRLSQGLGWLPGAAIAWVAYVVANAASGSLAIVAGALVAGGVWTALALWTHGVLASVVCHSLWTILMVLNPPGGPLRRHAPAPRSARARSDGT
jgi:membrane protease YdiL (CAAX protease family)